jgi:hypothetical protein
MSPYEIVRAALETAAVCSYLRDSSNETWSSFAAPCGVQRLVATDDCEECWRICCECGAGVEVKKRLRGPVPQPSEAGGRLYGDAESRKKTHVLPGSFI